MHLNLTLMVKADWFKVIVVVVVVDWLEAQGYDSNRRH